jgi:hypothetical protein
MQLAADERGGGRQRGGRACVGVRAHWGPGKRGCGVGVSRARRVLSGTIGSNLSQERKEEGKERHKYLEPSGGDGTCGRSRFMNSK